MTRRTTDRIDQDGPMEEIQPILADEQSSNETLSDELATGQTVSDVPQKARDAKSLPSGMIQSVVRAMSILELCAAEANGATARQVALSEGLSVPTASHLLSTLAYCGYLRKTSTRYALSWKIAELHSALNSGFAPSERAIETMNELVAITGETAYISSWIDGDVVVAAIAEGRQAVRVTGISLGMRGGAHSRASGKVLLRLGPPDRLSEYLASHPLVPYTSETITDPASLLKAVDLARSEGYALDRGERLDGVCCIAIPLSRLDSATSIAASVMVPESRFEALLDQHLDKILALSR